MDAGVMEGETCLFGAVGAIPGIKNPILVAKTLVQEQREGLLPLGRVPPSFLVGEGARDWALKKGFPSVATESLISEKALQLYKYYKNRLDNFRLSLKRRSLGTKTHLLKSPAWTTAWGIP
ncbi:Excision repair crosscomplementing rodent repair deficiency_ complementation group 4 [Caligus rogercresseyi]|uniref:Excision repair crosscomplementing rodent repair deficiency_ complementation group 4 n=1 Tax=Caligus rogercresseyi TaxID=217165 RepID=A0A7T8HL06_CALRO|nr:Excision repair crosscomplementing rodent repair deficiency_ complementation group 4 [Caligus rogercresseyi]